MSDSEKSLKLEFHGRIIDHLGIQMYQSSVAAIAEMISNAWDADSENVYITLPSDSSPIIIIRDDGHGMTFEECQNRFLKIGYCRRGMRSTETSRKYQRPILGRKGIGKFAGFGIAQNLKIETISEETGEKTCFHLDLNRIRAGEFITSEEFKIIPELYEGPDDTRKASHGTTITLTNLTVGRYPSLDSFSKSMARRFLLRQRANNFIIKVNDQELPAEDEREVQYVFPEDYHASEKPETITEVNDDGWATETLPSGNSIKWRFCFYREPIKESELRGVSIFAGGKLAQTPFFFNISGGIGAQYSLEYLSGQIEADFIDNLPQDIISPERQRINWQLPETLELHEWGQERLKSLFKIWKDRRGEERSQLIYDKIEGFKNRLDKLGNHEKRIIESALRKLAHITSITDEQFKDLGNSMLTAWEGGRLRDLIDSIANTPSMAEDALLGILVEAKALTALHTAEAVKAKLEIIAGLMERIKEKELENKVRDYIAENPWLIGSEWETFRVEKSIRHFMDDAGTEAYGEEANKKRIDLALSSGNQILVLEFMQPGLTIDLDHLNRYETYVDILRNKIKVNPQSGFQQVSGIVVADKLDRKPHIITKLERLSEYNMKAFDWESLLRSAASKWSDYIDLLIERAPADERLLNLKAKLK